MNEFRERFDQALTLLGEIGANHCGHLTRAQAVLLHTATQMLLDLDDLLSDES